MLSRSLVIILFTAKFEENYLNFSFTDNLTIVSYENEMKFVTQTNVFSSSFFFYYCESSFFFSVNDTKTTNFNERLAVSMV